jgi:GNAT superfamily N-acetyltransferase
MNDRHDAEHRIALDRVELEAARDMAHAAPADLARDLGMSGRDVAGTWIEINQHVDELEFNRALGLGLLAPASESDLDAIVQAYRSAGVARFFVPVHPDARPTGLRALLAKRGLSHYDNWVRLHRPAEPAAPVATEFQIERIGRDSAAIFADVVATGFGWDTRLGRLTAAPVGRPGWSHYLAYDGSNAVAAAALFVAGEYGWFGFAATLPSARGRGGQSALLAQRIDDARRAGCRWLSIETEEDRPERPSPSYRNIIRAGFSVAYVRPNHIGKPAELD